MFCQRFQVTLNYCLLSLPTHGSAMEGVMAMNNVEWTPESIKKAEKACKEAQQMVIIKTIDVSVPGDTSLAVLGWTAMRRCWVEAGTEKNEGGE